MAKQTYTTGQVLTAAQMTALQANDYNWTVSAKTASYVLVAADAGTRITMSNAGATTITVNTALFTAGDTLTITNIGAGACTITAGTATVSTAGSLVLNQYDSGTLYFSSTSVAIWNGANPGDITGVTAGTGISGGGTSGTVTVTNSMATEITASGDIIVGTGSGTFDNLPIGTTNQVLTADTTVSPYKVKWATPAGASASWSQLGVTATTSGTTVTVSGLSGYNQLYVSLETISSSSSTVTYSLRFNGDSGANYNMSQISIRNAPSQVAGNYLSGSTEIGLARIVTATNKMNGGFLINGANGSGKKVFSGFCSCDDDLVTTDIVKPNIYGTYDGTSVISSVSIITNGTAFDLGNIRVFGSVA